MKTIVFYGRTQVGSVVLSYLVARGYTVKVIPEDEIVNSLCEYYGLEVVTLKTMGDFDLFVCCHGEKIIDEEYLQEGKFINMHSCLWKYKGKDPVSRYIENKDTEASIESHYMTKEVDAGEVISRVLFKTPIVKTHGEYFNLALPYYYRCIDETLSTIWGSVKSAAMVRVKDDKIRFGLWLSYYSKYFDDLYVFSCGTPDGFFDEFHEKYKFTVIVVEDEIYGLGSHDAVFKKQEELIKENDWTLYTDMDEYVIPDPEVYKDLKDYMLKSRVKQPYCEGFEVFKSAGENDIDWSQPILQQRKKWVKDATGSYNKPALSKIKSDWVLGFHKLSDMADTDVKLIDNTGLYLAHVKHINDSEGVPSIAENKPEKIPEKVKLAL